VNLDSVFQSVDLSQVNAANFVVGNSGNIALLQAAPGSHIQLSSDLNIVDMTIAGASANNPGSLEIDLQTSALQGGPINIGLLDIFSATILTINSAGAGPNGINTIDTLAISDFQTLTISGDSDLTINSINGLVANDNQPVTIDAHTLSGSLQIDVSGIVDSAALGRSIIIVGGTANNILTNENVSENTTFIAGAGTNVINIGSGAIDNTVVNLKPLDRVNIGNATVTDAVIDATVAGAGQQDIDQQGTLGAAARLASILHGASTPDQALLFYYQGNLYAFVDVRGDHVFDATADAIVKLVGVTDVAHLSGVFHSA
jgi:ethanolamine utilization microcompartment shell protein EutS